MADREWHGLSDIPEYGIWIGMKSRCYDSNRENYPRYGGRGIKVCDRWLHSFTAFYDDMGPRPSPEHSINRIDNDGDYEPNNCRWATQEDQMWNTSRNRIIDLPDGTRTNLKDASEQLGLRIPTIKTRLYKNIPLDKPLTVRDKTYQYKGKEYTIGQLARLTDMDVSTVQSRINRGWEIDEAINSPAEENKFHLYNGKQMRLFEIAQLTNIPAYTLSYHTRKGRTVQQAINRVKLYEIETKTIKNYKTEYNLWNKLKSACSNPNNPDYKYYGAKGATMCDEWQESFIYFLNAIGPKPSEEYALKRLDETKPFESGNVEWRHKSEGVRNSQDCIMVKLSDGREMSVPEAAKVLGITHKGIYERLKNGIPVDAPLKGTYLYEGKYRKIREIAEMAGIPFKKLQKRVSRGHSLEKAISLGQ